MRSVIITEVEPFSLDRDGGLFIAYKARKRSGRIYKGLILRTSIHGICRFLQDAGYITKFLYGKKDNDIACVVEWKEWDEEENRLVTYAMPYELFTDMANFSRRDRESICRYDYNIRTTWQWLTHKHVLRVKIRHIVDRFYEWLMKNLL